MEAKDVGSKFVVTLTASGLVGLDFNIICDGPGEKGASSFYSQNTLKYPEFPRILRVKCREIMGRCEEVSGNFRGYCEEFRGTCGDLLVYFRVS